MAYRGDSSVYRYLQLQLRLPVVLQDGIFENDHTLRDDTKDFPRSTVFPQIPKLVFFTFFADALRDNKAVINMGTNNVFIQPHRLQRFTKQVWISKPAQRIRRQKRFVSNFPLYDQLAPQLPKLGKDDSGKGFSACTNLVYHSYHFMNTQKFSQ